MCTLIQRTKGKISLDNLIERLIWKRTKFSKPSTILGTVFLHWRLQLIATLQTTANKMESTSRTFMSLIVFTKILSSKKEKSFFLKSMEGIGGHQMLSVKMRPNPLLSTPKELAIFTNKYSNTSLPTQFSFINKIKNICINWKLKNLCTLKKTPINKVRKRRKL